jgi:hypothetical protein
VKVVELDKFCVQVSTCVCVYLCMMLYVIWYILYIILKLCDFILICNYFIYVGAIGRTDGVYVSSICHINITIKPTSSMLLTPIKPTYYILKHLLKPTIGAIGRADGGGGCGAGAGAGSPRAGSKSSTGTQMYFIIGVFSVVSQYNCVYYCDTS